MREGRVDEAKAMANQRLDAAITAVKENSNSATRTSLGAAFAQFGSTVGSRFPDDLQKAYETVEPILREVVESDAGTVSDYRAYQSMQTSMAMIKADVDAVVAAQILADTKAIGEKLGNDSKAMKESSSTPPRPCCDRLSLA